MKTVNLIFSILFLIWAIDILIMCNTELSTKKYYRFGFEEKKFNFFWTLIVFATTFNIFARIFNQCNFYLVGAFGFMTIFMAEYFCGIYFIGGKLMGHPDMKSERDHQKRFYNYCITLPFVIFGVLSSLCCYQTKIKERIDRNKSKLQQLFLHFNFTNHEQIILIFNAIYLLAGVSLFLVEVVEKMKIEFFYLTWFLPFIPAVSYFLAWHSKKEIIYNIALISWGTIAGFTILFSFLPFHYAYHNAGTGFDQIVKILAVILIFTINACIGYLTTLSIYRKKFKKEAGLGKQFNDQNFETNDDFDENDTEEGPSVKLFSNNIIIKV